MAGVSIGGSVGSSILGVLSWVLLALGALMLVLYGLRFTGLQEAPARLQDLAGGAASVIFGLLARLLARRFAAM